MDLRPEGKNGTVARSVDSYRAYYSRWGDIWENQALLRARMIYGSQELVTEFNEVIDQYRYPTELSSKSIIEIRRIKARIETERLPQGADPKRHLKLGRGSLSDIEWLVQLLGDLQRVDLGLFPSLQCLRAETRLQVSRSASACGRAGGGHLIRHIRA